MSRKNRETDYAAVLESDYARWNELFTKGGSDPSWSDGVNLNLVRNQIIYDKQKLAVWIARDLPSRNTSRSR